MLSNLPTKKTFCSQIVVFHNIIYLEDITMPIHDKIKTLREINHWTQEEMAEKINMSKNGYSKLERGETKLNIERLEQIANVFNLDLAELVKFDERGLAFLIGENNDYYVNNNYNNNAEIEKLNLIISHKDELLVQKDNEISALKALVELLQNSK